MNFIMKPQNVLKYVSMEKLKLIQFFIIIIFSELSGKVFLYENSISLTWHFLSNIPEQL